MSAQGPLAEYLYIDQQRLDSYAEQISGQGLIAYDKTPEWTVELSTVGPKVSGAQKRLGRSMTTNEKIALLMDWVAHHGGAEGDLFRLETIRAQRAVIPLKSETSVNKLLSVWISTTEDRTTYLAEDFHIGDLGTRGLSAGLAFQMILKEFSESAKVPGLTLQWETKFDERASVSCPGLCARLALASYPEESFDGDVIKLQDSVRAAINEQCRLLKEALVGRFSPEANIIRIQPEPNWGNVVFVHINLVDGSKRFDVFVFTKKSIPEEYGTEDTLFYTRDIKGEAAMRFVTDSARLLVEGGAALGSPQDIDSLYRVRHFFQEDFGKRSMIGYPIFVCTHPSPWGPETLNLPNSKTDERPSWIRRVFRSFVPRSYK